MINKNFPNYSKEKIPVRVLSSPKGENRAARRTRTVPKKRYGRDHRNDHSFANNFFFAKRRQLGF